jgi:hypothetical protein
MQDTLLFTTSAEMSSVLDKIQNAFPTVRFLSLPREGSNSFPVGIDLGAVDERMWCEWALENGVFSYCHALVLLSLNPPEWMKPLMKFAKN